MRILVDVTFARRQTQAIGITRVVRRLFESLKARLEPSGGKCLAVTYHPRGYRLITGQRISRATSAIEPVGNSSVAPSLLTKRSLNLFSLLRDVVAFAVKVLPWSLLAGPWILASNALEAFRSKDDVPLQFNVGDVLLVADVAWGYASWQAAAAAKAQGAKVIVVVYDLMPIRQPQYCYALVPKVYDMWLRRMAILSDRMMCISKATTNDVLAWVREMGLPPELEKKVSSFSLGSDFQGVSNSGEIRPAISKHFTAGEPCFGMIGTFEPKKNYELVWQVFSNLWTTGERVRLAVVGRRTDEMASFIETMNSDPKNQGRLLLVHDANDAEVDYVYSQARALIMASKFEGYGLPLVEARARGAPVIASNIPSFVELKDDGVWIFDLEAPTQLEALVLEHATRDQRPVVGSAEVPKWCDSAKAILIAAENI